MQDELKGKDAKFDVVIKEIKVKELPELDDEFVIDVSEFDTLAEYKEDIKKNLEEDKKANAKAANENNLIAKVVENAEIELPEVMVENQIEAELNDFAYRLQMQGLSVEQYFAMTGTTMEAFKENVKPVAENRVLTELVLDAIGEVEKIQATDEDVDKELDKIAEQYNQEDVAKFKEDMKKGDLDYLYKGISREKTVEFLMNNAKLK